MVSLATKKRRVRSLDVDHISTCEEGFRCSVVERSEESGTETSDVEKKMRAEGIRERRRRRRRRRGGGGGRGGRRNVGYL